MFCISFFVDFSFTTLYPGISLDGLVPSSVGERGLPSLSTCEVSGCTVGVYLAVTGVPFLSTRLTVTPFSFSYEVRFWCEGLLYRFHR